MSRTLKAATLLAVTLLIPLAGCSSGKLRLSAERMCAASSGKYSPQTQTCDAPPLNARKASEMCQAHGGVYDPVLQVCAFEGVK